MPADLLVERYDAKKARSARVSSEESRSARDIAPLPPVQNPIRKIEASRSFRRFCELYFPEAFPLAWSDDHLKAIAKIEAAVIRGGTFAFAMARGSGKTTMSIKAAVWAILTGHRTFVALVGADEDAAGEMLDTIKSDLSDNALLLKDFPECVYPIHRLEGIAHRAAGQIYLGKSTKVGWLDDRVQLPTLPMSPASGATIRVAGITGRVRGMHFQRPDGRIARPDLVIVDDPQTDESAHSLAQCVKRERIITSGILGLAGPGRKIAGVMPCTVIQPGDLADRMLDRGKHPEWQGERMRLMNAWPTNETLWDQYYSIRADSLRSGDEGRQATEFYQLHQTEMDAGAEPAWAQRYNPDELSAVQCAMNLRQDRGVAAVAAEYQNQPLIEQTNNEACDADEILAKTNGVLRGTVPIGCEQIVAYVDVQGSLLYYCIVAFGQNFTGAVIDYGSYPDQKRPYFTLADARSTLARKFPAAGQEGQIYSGLDALGGELASRVWHRADGAEMRLDRGLVDANWGVSTDTVYLWCRQGKHGGKFMPAHGMGLTASSTPWERWKQKEGERLGNHWIIPSIKATRAVRYVRIDTNFWKTFCQSRLRVSLGDPGCLSLFTPSDREGHRMFADHLTAEYGTKTSGNGRTLVEWRLKPGKPDNHFFDCIVGAHVAASMLGVNLDAAIKLSGPKPAAKPRRSKVTYL